MQKFLIRSVKEPYNTNEDMCFIDYQNTFDRVRQALLFNVGRNSDWFQTTWSYTTYNLNTSQ